MDGWQRKSWNTHYFPDTRIADIASDELLFLHIQLHIRPLGRILEQTILRGALQEPTYQVSAQGELTMYLILYQQECVSRPVMIYLGRNMLKRVTGEGLRRSRIREASWVYVEHPRGSGDDIPPGREYGVGARVGGEPR